MRRLRDGLSRSYFAPALFSLIPVATDLIDSMAVDAGGACTTTTWVARHTVEENATLLIHEVGHLLRDHEARRRPPASRIIGAGTLPATARSMTISTPRAAAAQAIRRYPRQVRTGEWRHCRGLLRHRRAAAPPADHANRAAGEAARERASGSPRGEPLG